jgi:hypothetical protein
VITNNENEHGSCGAISNNSPSFIMTLGLHNLYTSIVVMDVDVGRASGMHTGTVARNSNILLRIDSGSNVIGIHNFR